MLQGLSVTAACTVFVVFLGGLWWRQIERPRRLARAQCAMARYVLSLGKGFCLWHSSITAICRRTCAGVTTSGVPCVSVA